MTEQQITLILVKNDEMIDITELVEQIEWSGRKGAAPRTLKVSLLDSSEYDRSGIDVQKGHNILFQWNGESMFYGMVLRQEDSENRIMNITAYDVCRYLANNKDSFTYENKTLTYIFRDVCERFQLPVGNVVESSYKIDKVSGLMSTPWDLLCDAMLETFQYSGERYYIYADTDKINLVKRRETMIKWIVEAGSNLITYKRLQDFSNIKTRVKLIGDKDAVILTETDENLENVFGIYQDVDKPNKDLSTSKYKQIAQNKLKFDGRPDCYIQITGIGITDCISGCSLKLIIPEIDINDICYIDEEKKEINKGKIVVVCAGTSDLPVAREAYLTAQFLGNEVELVSDVGVAGIHRLFHRLDVIQEANVLVVCAGMEGALGTVIAGLADAPVIAVPTSVGYGASFHGLSALLTMINSCANGISVVNIDNGYGAGYIATQINRMGVHQDE